MKNIFGKEETRKVVQAFPLPDHLKDFARVPLYFTDEQSPYRPWGTAVLDNGEMATIVMRGVSDYMIVTVDEMALNRGLETVLRDIEDVLDYPF